MLHPVFSCYINLHWCNIRSKKWLWSALNLHLTFDLPPSFMYKSRSAILPLFYYHYSSDVRDSKNQIYKADELIFISKEEYLLRGRPVCNQNYLLAVQEEFYAFLHTLLHPLCKWQIYNWLIRCRHGVGKCWQITYLHLFRSVYLYLQQLISLLSARSSVLCECYRIECEAPVFICIL